MDIQHQKNDPEFENCKKEDELELYIYKAQKLDKKIKEIERISEI